jgi:hypothetical protein
MDEDQQKKHLEAYPELAPAINTIPVVPTAPSKENSPVPAFASLQMELVPMQSIFGSFEERSAPSYDSFQKMESVVEIKSKDESNPQLKRANVDQNVNYNFDTKYSTNRQTNYSSLLIISIMMSIIMFLLTVFLNAASSITQIGKIKINKISI